MAYATNSEVASEFKKITFDSNSTVTDTEVDTFIDQADEYINGRIGGKYKTPVTQASSPKAFKILKMISIWLVADRVREIMQVKGINTDIPKQGTRPAGSAAKAKALLKEIADGDLLLSDVDVVSSSDGFSGFGVAEGFEHHFQRSENADDPVNQW